MIPSLDGLRAVSIIIVFLSHAFPDGGRITIPGGFGVTVFFFLSGFLITTLMRREVQEAGRLSFRGFYLRRLLRIFPPMLAMLAVFSIACSLRLILFRPTLETYAVSILQAGNYWIVWHGRDSLGPGVGPLWSLAVEEHFYLLFPVLYAALWRWQRDRRRQVFVLGGICAAFLAWRLVLAFAFHVGAAHLRLSSDTRLDSILFGCILAIWGNPVLDATAISQKTWTNVLFPLGIVALAASHVIPGAMTRESLKCTLEGIALVPVFVVGVRYPTWGPFRVLNLKPVAYLGVLSYAFYLVHGVVLQVIERFAPPGDPRVVFGGFAAAIAVSWFFHAAIEEPMIRLRRRLSWASPARARH